MKLPIRLRSSATKMLLIVSFVLAFQGILGASSANASCVTVNQLAAVSAGNGTYETCGGDDLSYRIPITGTVIFGGVTYSTIYATNNSIITFGQPDYNFYSFPNTPSISLDAKDWMQDGFVGEDGTSYGYNSSGIQDRLDEFFIITVSGETFRVDIAARPFSTYYNSQISGVPDGTPTRLILNFVRKSDGTLRITSFTSDATDTALRNGCVLSEGATAISLADCGIIEVATVEAILYENPSNYLVATTPLVVSQTKDAITCTAATLKYMADGVQTSAPKLTAQSYSVKVDGKIVAQKITLDASASFDKKLLPTSGVATCSQVATQDGSQVVVESEISTSTGDAAKTRKAEVAKIHADFKAESQKLMSAKLAHLNTKSTSTYREASEKWQAALLDAQLARDAAIKAAYAKEIKAAFDSGLKINIQP